MSAFLRLARDPRLKEDKRKLLVPWTLAAEVVADSLASDPEPVGNNAEHPKAKALKTTSDSAKCSYVLKWCKMTMLPLRRRRGETPSDMVWVAGLPPSPPEYMKDDDPLPVEFPDGWAGLMSSFTCGQFRAHRQKGL